MAEPETPTTTTDIDIDAELTAFAQSSMPLCGTLGIVAHEMSAARAVLSLGWAETLCTTAGLMHGGAMMALADAAGAACAYANLPEGAHSTSTIESKTNFLGAVKSGSVLAVSTPLHVGGSTIVIETELRNNGRLVGKTTQTQSVLRPQ